MQALKEKGLLRLEGKEYPVKDGDIMTIRHSGLRTLTQDGSMNPLLTSHCAFALAAALANVIGGVIVTSHKWARRSLRYFIALGSGFMLGTVFLEMVPESFELTAVGAGADPVGYLIVHMFEHTFASHLHFGEETHHDEVTNPVVGISALVGMLVHTFFDGVAIGAGF